MKRHAVIQVTLINAACQMIMGKDNADDFRYSYKLTNRRANL